MSFLAIFDVFACFFREKGPKFFGGPIFFSQKFDPRCSQNTLFGILKLFWLIMHYFLVRHKKSFSLFFNINWGQAKKYGPKNPGGMVFACHVNKKLLDLGPRGPKVPKKTKNS